MDDGTGDRADCGACGLETRSLTGFFEAVEEAQDSFLAVLVESPHRTLVRIDALGVLTRAADLGDRPVLDVVVADDLRAWLIDDRGTVSVATPEGTVTRTSREDLGVWAHRLAVSSLGVFAEVCADEATDECRVRALVELAGDGTSVLRRVFVADEDLLHASVHRMSGGELVCWVFQNDRRLRCRFPEADVVWPPSPDIAMEHAFEETFRFETQIIDNTCTMFDIGTRGLARVPGSDASDCLPSHTSVAGHFVTRSGCLTVGGLLSVEETSYVGTVCGVPDSLRDVAILGGTAAVIHHGGELALLRSNLFD